MVEIKIEFTDMKKIILIVCSVLAFFSLTAFGYMNWSNNIIDHKVLSHPDSYQNKTNNPEHSFANLINKYAKPDFFYDIDSRFLKTITKSELQNAKSIHDIFSSDETKGIESFRDVNISILPRDAEKFAKGDGNQLNSTQLELLQSTEYSNDICIEAFCKRQNSETWITEEYCFVYYITIVPEKEAEFKDGQQALIKYLKENSKEEAASVNRDRLEPGKVRFVVTKNGKIGPVALESTSGYDAIDDKMLKLIMNLPGEWMPATNSKGKKVDQEFIYSFGIVGC